MQTNQDRDVLLRADSDDMKLRDKNRKWTRLNKGDVSQEVSTFGADSHAEAVRTLVRTVGALLQRLMFSAGRHLQPPAGPRR